MSIENGNLHLVKVFNELTFDAYYEPCIYSTRELAEKRAEHVNSLDAMKATVNNWKYESK